MANETITGCVNPDGSIEFDQDPDCTYSGCLVESGIHADQVAVTIETDNCDDTYYGCVDKSTGKFEVSIPDDCCTWDPEPADDSCPCGLCETHGYKQPDKVIMLVTNIVGCTGCYQQPVPGPWFNILPANQTIGAMFNGYHELNHWGGCLYNKKQSISSTAVEEDHGGAENCSGLVPGELSVTELNWELYLEYVGYGALYGAVFLSTNLGQYGFGWLPAAVNNCIRFGPISLDKLWGGVAGYCYLPGSSHYGTGTGQASIYIPSSATNLCT